MDALYSVRCKQAETDLALDQLRVACACLTSRHHARIGALQQQLEDLTSRWHTVKSTALAVRRWICVHVCMHGLLASPHRSKQTCSR